MRCEVDAAPLLLVTRTAPLPQPAVDYLGAVMRAPQAREAWKVPLLPTVRWFRLACQHMDPTHIRGAWMGNRAKCLGRNVHLENG